MATDYTELLAQQLSGGFDPQQAKLRLLQQQLEQAHALSGAPVPQHSTGLGAALGGLGHVVGVYKAGQQAKDLRGQLDSLTGQQGAQRQSAMDLLVRRAARQQEQEQAASDQAAAQRMLENDPQWSGAKPFAEMLRKYGQNPEGLSAAQMRPMVGVAQKDWETGVESGDRHAGFANARTLKQMDIDADAEKAKLAAPEKLRSLGEGLRKEYLGNQSTKNLQILKGALDQVRGSSAGGAGDIRLLYGYMKVLDPNSSVRESEFATAGAAGGLPGQIQGYFNQLTAQGFLAPEVRKQIKTESEAIAQGAVAAHAPVADSFGALAEQAGIPRGDVVIDLGFAPAAAAAEVSPAAQRQLLEQLRSEKAGKK